MGTGRAVVWVQVSGRIEKGQGDVGSLYFWAEAAFLLIVVDDEQILLRATCNPRIRVLSQP
jgi:hypothetical protein